MNPYALLLAGLPGNWEWLIVLFVILLLFGRRLPGVARSLGQGISSFKKGLRDPVEEGKDAGGDAELPPKSAAREKATESAEG